MRYPVVEVDVFTATPLFGNPVAVVLEAASLTDDDMARIANWTNFSETTFVTGIDERGYDVRIFTPHSELPFAGHPSVGTAYALWSRGLIAPTQTDVVQRCKAGPIAVRREDEHVFVQAPAPKLQEIDSGELDRALGTRVEGVCLRVDVGAVWLVAQVIDRSTLRKLEPDFARLAKLSVVEATNGVTVYARDDDGAEVRSFAPSEGIDEDPVCGSGNASVAAHIQHVSGVRELLYEARQGASVRRDGRVQVKTTNDAIWIGGRCCEVITGELEMTSG